MSWTQRWVATRQGFKPRDVEEFIDYYWHRPLAGLLVDAIKDWPITPNQITVASGVFSLLSGLAMLLAAYYSPWLSALGALLLLSSIVLDCADGQLARIKGISSPVGRALDGAMDSVAPLCVFHGMAFFLLERTDVPFWTIWTIGSVTAASLVWHVQQYDVSKNVYLHASRPDFSLGGDTLLTPERMHVMAAEYDERGEPFNAWMMRVWMKWTRPQVRQLRPWLEYERSPQNEPERELYRELFTPLMRALTWIGFGTHLFIFTIAALLAPLDPRALWVAWALVLGPLNIVAAWYAIVRPRREREFVERLAAMRDRAGSA